MTISSVNDEIMKLELSLREVTCEVPKCQLPAAFVIKSGLAALICAEHHDIHQMSKPFARAIESAIRNAIQLVESATAHAAYAESDNEVLFKYESGDLLASARTAAGVLDKVNSDYRRRKDAEYSAAELIRFRQNRKDYREGLKNPTLADLEEGNAEQQIIDIFTI